VAICFHIIFAESSESRIKMRSKVGGMPSGWQPSCVDRSRGGDRYFKPFCGVKYDFSTYISAYLHNRGVV